MRRRTLLASAAALLSTPAVSGLAGATDRVTTDAPTDGFGPLGHVGITDAFDAVVSGTTAYVAADTGFVSVDVSDPAEPELLAERRGILSDLDDGPLSGIYDLGLDGDRLVVAGPANPNPSALNGLAVFDVSDPAAPERVTVHRTDFSIHNLVAVEGYAYLTGNNRSDNPLVVVDISGEPTEVGRWSLFDHDEAWREVTSQFRVIHDVYVRDGLAYLAHWDAGTWVVDVSDPSDISFVSRIRGRPAADLADVALEDTIREYIQLPGNDHYVTVDESGDLLAVGAEAWEMTGDDIEGGPGGIELYDISTIEEPERLAHIDPPETSDPTRGGVWTTAHNFDFSAGRLYSSWYRGGVRVHDLSDPANPREIAHWEDRDAAEFFTALRPEGQPFFVGTSLASGSGSATINGALYTFPVPEVAASEDGLSPTTTTSVSHDSCADHPTCDPATYGEDPTTTAATPTTTPPPETTVPTATATPTPETPASETAVDSETTASGSGPGFGVVGALSALAAGGYSAIRGREDENETD